MAVVFVVVAIVFSGHTTLQGLLRFDGVWYARIAMHGYAPVAGPMQPSAFLPLFPAVVAVAHAALPFISLPLTGVLVNVAATVGAAMLVAETLREWPLRDRLLAVVALLVVPSAFFDVMFYSEGLFFLATALVLWSVQRPQRLWWAPLGVVAATLDRPVGLFLVVIVAAAVLHDTRPRWQRAVIVVASAAGAAVLPVMYWRVAGSPFAFLTAEQAWSSLRTIGAGDALRWMVVQLNPSTSTNPVVFFGNIELLLVGVPLLYAIRRHRAAALYCALAMVVAFVNGNLGAQSRYLATLVPLWLLALALLRSRLPRGWIPITVAVSVLGLASNVWLLSRFAAGVWAG
ncbi:MAG: hypothetical protein ACREN2_11495 [Candidatus Dormibacteria bacterium]